MEGVRAGDIPMPSQQRLSRLYNDTKKSSDFVTQPVQHAEDPEIKAVHRKLRIQKDRFVSWGLAWSDPTQTAEIDDESLSKAGLSEIVGSVLSTIRDILAEAEPLWKSSKALVGGPRSERPSGDKKVPLVSWDKGRFEDLVRDLTTSIDTLYDLSRTRSSAMLPPTSPPSGWEKLSKSSSSAGDLKPFGSSRMQTPQQIDPSSLTSLRAFQSGFESKPSASSEREVVFMDKQAWFKLTQRIDPHTWTPLLLEFASFDSIYANTGITPPMAGFERLSAALQGESTRSQSSWTGLPRLLGYYEDLERSRLCLLYHLPRGFGAASSENLAQHPFNHLCTLSDLLNRPNFEPRLEAKFRLALNLSNTVFDLHARGITHGNLADGNVSFCNEAGNEYTKASAEVDVRRPLISSFDIFPDSSATLERNPFLPLFRHPLDPRTVPAGPITDKTDTRILDLYSLAMILVSIGLWTKLENLVPDPSFPSLPESILEQLAIRCGTPYMKAVQLCWEAVDQELAGKSSGDELLSTIQLRTSRYLEACCILDGAGGMDAPLGSAFADALPASEGPIVEPRSAAGPSEHQPQIPSSFTVPNTRAKMGEHVRSAGKLRTYPQVPLAPEIVDRWNNTVMPKINQTLRHFYRKHTESVEISLESVGNTAQTTTPTVMVVCTSVRTVKAILTRKAGELFEGASGFGLKVCKGRVLRSRKRPVDPERSTARDDSAPKAANPGWQERPNNGASIGAWIGDRHLPPVSLGGLVMVDGKAYGMTVHHMLDDQEQMHSPSSKEAEFPQRSAARPDDSALRAFYGESLGDSSGTEDFECEFSEEEIQSETDLTSDISDDEESDGGEYEEPGDLPGIEPGLGKGFVITQPAMDDVDEEFYPLADTANEDHLATCSLGEMYASSGIRRRETSGLVHEVDWALFEFHDERRPHANAIPPIRTGHRAHAASSTTKKNMTTKPTGDTKRPSVQGEGVGNDLHPTMFVPSFALPGTQVQCIARTSGLQTGQVLSARASIKLFGRLSPSDMWQVSSHPALSAGGQAREPEAIEKQPLPIGLPGDSGAWIVERGSGRVCGHVLAWSERKKVAYICPMDVLLKDIAETLDAEDIRLPGGSDLAGLLGVDGRHDDGGRRGDGDEDEDEEDEPEFGRCLFADPHDEDLGDLVELEGDEVPIRVPPPSQGHHGRGEHSKRMTDAGWTSSNSRERAGSSSPTSLDVSRGIASMDIRDNHGVGMCS